jgi:YVTN family beta-propeller protein
VSLSVDPRIGSELLGYRIESLLGRGGMSVVYLAEDLRLRRRVALKLLAPPLAEDEAFRVRFLEESQLAASLDHPNVVPIFEAGEAADELYIAMRYVEGEDLKSLLREGPLTPERAIAVCGQVADALDFAHGRGLVHRDVKPSNVLLDAKEHVYLADFGLTKRVGEGRTTEPGLFGTIDYIAPEQIRGDDVDGRADVYALGCLFYECLAGEPPFQRGNDAATLYAHLEESPPTLPELEEVLSKALAKDPDERFQTCAELIEAARIRLGFSKPRRSLWPAAAAVVGLAVVAAALLAFFLARGGSGSTAGRGGSLVRIDPTTNEPKDAIRVGAAPSSVSASPDGVWIADYRGSALWRVNPRTLAVAEVPANGAPQDVAMYRGTAYVAANGPTEFAGNVTKYDARIGARNESLGLPSCVKSVVAGSLGVWASPCPMVAHVSLDAKPKVLRTIIPPFPTTRDAAHDRETLNDMALGMGSVWVIGDALDPRVWRIDPRSGGVATLALLPGTFAPYRVAAGAGAVWVTDQLNDRVARVDPVTGRVVASIAVGHGAGGVAVGAGSVWVANTLEGTVSRIDPETNRVVATIRVPGRPKDVSVGAGSVWAVGDAT